MAENSNIESTNTPPTQSKIRRRSLLAATAIAGPHFALKHSRPAQAKSPDNQPAPANDTTEPYNPDSENQDLRSEVMRLYNNPVGPRKTAVELRYEVIQSNTDDGWFELAENIHFFGADLRKKNLFAVPKEEAKNLVSDYYPIYLTAQKEFGIPWQLLALIHAAETGCSTHASPDHYSGGYKYVGAMQRSTTFYTDKLVSEISKGYDHLGFLPQNYLANPARDELTDKIISLNVNSDNFNAEGEQRLVGYEGNIYQEEMERFKTGNKSATNDWEEILFAAWKLTKDAKGFFESSQNTNKPLTQEQALYKAMLAYSADRHAIDRWNQFQGLREAGKNRGLIIDINLNFQNPKLDLDPNDFK